MRLSLLAKTEILASEIEERGMTVVAYHGPVG